MKRLFLIILSLLLLSFFLGGCVAATKGVKATPEIYQKRASAYEQKDEPQLTLFNWKIAGHLKPADSQIAARINSLNTTISKKAESHYKKGLSYYKKKSFNAARKEFLIALRYDPNHIKSFDYLKNILYGREYFTYEAKKEDTIKKISQKFYQDTEKAFIIDWFNDRDATSKLSAGTVVKIPDLEKEYTTPLIDIKEELSKANNLLKEKKYDEVLPVAQDILAYDPDNKRATYLTNMSYYQIGNRLSSEKKYVESLSFFAKVDSGFKGLKDAISRVKNTIIKLAEEHYRKGVNYFVNEKLKEAIIAWGQALNLYPEHPKAKTNIENAKRLLEKLNKM